ncbi:MAG: hypothetical protein ACK2T1_09340, partial [Candidatus Promineifilaceae bacterium]
MGAGLVKEYFEMANNSGNGREASLEKTLDLLTKKYGEGTIMRMGEASHLQIEAIPTGALSLDIA